ncbi:MAG: hypothetical protein J0L70_26610 [Leptolyngbya sp. UWPOB_LEPTO1]|uniref:hypothetical protein n=1 Tax=Leptolyngbya sp. UWPOB_LEPTO1 TaxID=2815653 RepID=UPI001AD5610A|nr:hypothetical protein [Leptolyngbya sp. UWPOB_LEPTO1]MBN8564113.1 hypothetical protein [Leptolyngbya sp. UWPOB_LEPTO1]
MTQLLSSIGRAKAKQLKIDAYRVSGRIEAETDLIFYGSNHPRLNRCNPANLSPIEKKSKGYRDGFAGVSSAALSQDPHYSSGWNVGYADHQIYLLQQDGLSIVFGDPDLDKVLTGLSVWQAKAIGGETVEIRYFATEQRYVLCTSISLLDRELDF